MLELLSKGNFWVMLSLGEKTSKAGPPWDDVIPIARAYIDAAPDRCVWASDWPHPVSVVQPPNDADLLELLYRYAPDEAELQKILVTNPAKLFGYEDDDARGVHELSRPRGRQVDSRRSQGEHQGQLKRIPMRIDPAYLDAETAYRLITGVVVPRPIAWVTSLSGSGVLNLAPFSAFTFVSPKPPMLAISVGRKGGIYKDTAQNILNNEEYVVHIADSSLMTAVHESSTEHPPDVSEVEELRLSTLPGERVKVPRLVAAPIAMECRFRQCLEFGETRSRLIVGEVLVFHIRDGLLQNGKIETKALDPIARIAGPRYARLGEIVTLKPVFQTSKTKS